MSKSERILNVIRTPHFIVGAGIAILILLLWLPFGFNVGFWGDDWYFFIHSEMNEPWTQLSRPLGPLFYNIGQKLTSNSFVGFNIVLMILIWLRSFILFLILEKLKTPQAFSITTAVITTLLPIDSGVFFMGALNVYGANVAYLGAVFFLILYWKRPSLYYFISMCILQLICVATYEAQYPLILVTPLILFLLDAKRNKHFFKVIFRWYLFPVIWLFILGILYLQLPTVFSYQSRIGESGGGIFSIVEGLTNVYRHHFWGSWVQTCCSDINHSFFALNPFVITGVIITGGFLIVILLNYANKITKLYPIEKRFSPVLYLLIGLAIIGLAVVVYMFTGLRNTTLRTYFVSSIGASLTITSGLWILSSKIKRNYIFNVAILLLSLLGIYRLLEQHTSFVRRSNEQQNIVFQFTTLIPAVDASVGIIISDETPKQELIRIMDGRWHFPYPFVFAYDHSTIDFILGICDFRESSEIYVEQDLSLNECHFLENDVFVYVDGLADWRVAYERLILVRYTPEGEFIVESDLLTYIPNADAVGYDPFALFDPNAPSPERVQRLFYRQPD